METEAARPPVIKLVSSNIEAVSHDARVNELRIRFKGGGAYAYERVPRELYAELASAESPGAFFAQRIRGVFKSRKL